MITNDPKVLALDYAEVKDLLRDHFAEVLERVKCGIDKDGALSLERVAALQSLQQDVCFAISHKQDELHGHMFSDDADIPEELSLNKSLKPIADKHGISLDRDSRERTALRREYKHALSGYLEALLAYNDSDGYYDYSEPILTKATSCKDRSYLKLASLISRYLAEDTDNKRRGFRDKQDSVNYLLEVLGDDYLITDVDYSDVRKVKDMLVSTPANRNRKPQTRDVPLERQIEIAKELQLERFADTNVNKYLGYMSGLFKWAKQNKYVSENLFEGVKVRLNKAKVRRVAFSKDEVRRILRAASQMDIDKPLNKTRYWALLLYVYTGARLNEIASLTPDDVKQYNGIWYLNITDLEEGKRLKTAAAKRLVPIHSKLLELGFLQYVDHARAVIAKIPRTGDHATRLLYKLTYTQDALWGKKLTKWVNEDLLPSLDLKGDGQVLHSLRHSFITMLNNAKVPKEEIAALAGHEQGTVTFSVYAKFDEDHLPVSQDAIEQLPY